MGELQSTKQSAIIRGDVMRPSFPMKDGNKTVPIIVTQEALEDMGFSGGGIDECEAVRYQLETIARQKYDGTQDKITICSSDVLKPN